MSTELKQLFSAVNGSLKLNLADITHEDSIKQIGNCNSINWIVGHIVIIRNDILSKFNKELSINNALVAMYKRGSLMMTDMSKAERLENLIKLFDESQKKIEEIICKEYNDELMEQLTIYGYHDGYHIGQLGIMRKLIGKEGAIK